MSLRNFLASTGYVTSPQILDPEHEMASAIRQSCDQGGLPIMSRTSSEHKIANQLIGSVYGTKDRVKKILGGINYDDKFVRKSDLAAVKAFNLASDISESSVLDPYIIPTGSENAPCHEVVLAGDKVDLRLLPICTHNELDKGPFITAGVNVVKWINGITHGLGIHRMAVINKNHLSCLAPPNRRVGFPHYEASKNGSGVKMAVCIGAPPEVVLASQSKVTSRCEKYIVASKIRQHPIPMTKCFTSDLLVPSETEIILECTTIPNSEYDDTPFAEYPGTYSFRSNSWVCKVDAITTRKNPIYQTILTGKTPQEDSNLCAIPYAAEVYRQASTLVEEITDISAFIGNNVFDTILCIKKTSNSQVQNLMHSLLGNKYLKSITIMDRDMSADEDSWRFCFNTRYQPNRDTIITNLGLGASLDPSSPLFQSTSKIAMDFTIPIGKTQKETDLNWMRHRVAKTKELPFSIDWTYSK